MQTKIIEKKQDLTHLLWSKIRNSSGTAGSFLKSQSDLGGKKIYYKLSNFDTVKGVVGHECINELIVDRLLTIFGIEHLHYQLIHSDILIDGKRYTTYLCASEDFRDAGESKIAIDAYFQAERYNNEGTMDFCLRMGWAEYIYQMLAVDFLILNRDRHGANIEVLRNSRKKTLRLAPLFDHGLSLLCSCSDEASVNVFDVMADKPIQCFLGSRSAKDNLSIIPVDGRSALNPLNESDKAGIFDGLSSALPQVWQDKIWEMLWRRWLAYEDFCGQGYE